MKGAKCFATNATKNLTNGVMFATNHIVRVVIRHTKIVFHNVTMTMKTVEYLMTKPSNKPKPRGRQGGRPPRYGESMKRYNVFLTAAQVESLKQKGESDNLSRAVQNIASQ